MSRVFIGSPLRNRGWILQEHLDSLMKQLGIIPEFCYVLNNSTDDTESILKKNKIRYIRHDIEHPTTDWVRGGYSFDDLAEVRNVFLEEFLKSNCDYLFSIDSDIILDSTVSILDLVLNDRDIVSALIKNSPTIYAHNILIKKKQPKNLKFGLIPVDTTGAVYLIKREVIEDGVRYGYHELGEDVFFCERASEKKFKMFCDTTIRATHVFTEGNYLYPNI
jgi:hypothetical protein